MPSSTFTAFRLVFTGKYLVASTGTRKIATNKLMLTEMMMVKITSVRICPTISSWFL